MESTKALSIARPEDVVDSPLPSVVPKGMTSVDFTDQECENSNGTDTDKENHYHHHDINEKVEKEKTVILGEGQHPPTKQQEDDINHAIPSPPSSLGSHSPNSPPTFKPVPCKRKLDDTCIQSGEEKQTKAVRLDDSDTCCNPSLSSSPSSSSLLSPPPADDLPTTEQSGSTEEPPIWCRRCGVTESVRWRYGPLGKSTLCNACHLRWKSVGKPDEGYSYTTYPPEGAASIQASRKPKSRLSGTKSKNRSSIQRPTVVKSAKTTIEAEDKTIARPVRRMTVERKTKAPTPEASKDASSPSSIPSSSSSASTENVKPTLENPFSHIPTDENMVQKGCCSLCNATSTSLWRKGPAGPRTLCNACGLRWAKWQQESGTMTTTTSSRALSSPTKTVTSDKTKEAMAADLGQQLLRNRKVFLKAGMYAALHKSVATATTSRPRKAAAAMKGPPKMHWKGNGSQTGGSSKFTVAAPIHQGTFIMSTVSDFCLPPDIIQEYELGLIGKFGSRPTLMKKPSFVRIRSNIFVERKANRTEHQVACQCIPPTNGELGCGEDCLNRRLISFAVLQTRERGWGLRTLAEIKRGELIIEYRGEIISHKTCEERMNTLYKHQKNFYFLDYRNGEVIDACTKGTEARFINHSCDPNCHIEKWALRGELHVGVFASKDIPANSELFYDYNFSVFGNTESQQRCYCGSSNCRGTIGRKTKST
ncbi:Histone-Lysine N-Methyltransferase ash1l [Apophysomyces ossiformis]|uniref:Histone-Lysine N-Methyltransferase ash1l n=1 Tax=Apophysomyces ossiformis TaxID=679940 RepID=A0A8H7BTY1_9FUNG|nr:Histone-Lysine N-Methyltransferase ash1l [Apophysomyces ossiformis]